MVMPIKIPKMLMVIQAVSPSPSSTAGGLQTDIENNESGMMEASIHDLLRPSFEMVLSPKYPNNGEDIASTILDSPKTTPITTGVIMRTSVENFMRYVFTRIIIHPRPSMGRPYSNNVPMVKPCCVWSDVFFIVRGISRPGGKQNNFLF